MRKEIAGPHSLLVLESASNKLLINNIPLCAIKAKGVSVSSALYDIQIPVCY